MLKNIRQIQVYYSIFIELVINMPIPFSLSVKSIKNMFFGHWFFKPTFNESHLLFLVNAPKIGLPNRLLISIVLY